MYGQHDNLRTLVNLAAGRISRLEEKGFHTYPPGTYQHQTYQSALLEHGCLEKQYTRLARKQNIR